MNKILLHVTKPWKTFRNDQPPNYVLQNILQHRFDQIFEPEGDMNQVKEEMAKKSGVPFDLLLKVTDEPKISKEEENTFIYQLDILRGIHADLNSLAHEVNHLLGFQILVHIITSVVFVVMWGIFEMQVLDICRGGRKWLYPALENRLIARGRSSSLKLALIY